VGPQRAGAAGGRRLRAIDRAVRGCPINESFKNGENIAMLCRVRHLLVPSALCLILLAGCGYTANGDDPNPASGYQWRTLYRGDVRTVAVPIFTNKDFHRGVEFSLTKAVQGDIEAHTPYKVVSRDTADTILEGEIIGVKETTLDLNSVTSTPQSQLMQITVNLIWKRIKTGEILMSRKNFEQTATYYPLLGESSQVGQQQAVEQLAHGIVEEMQADW
jgi:hypothetical protein